MMGHELTPVSATIQGMENIAYLEMWKRAGVRFQIYILERATCICVVSVSTTTNSVEFIFFQKNR